MKPTRLIGNILWSLYVLQACGRLPSEQNGRTLTPTATPQATTVPAEAAPTAKTSTVASADPSPSPTATPTPQAATTTIIVVQAAPTPSPTPPPNTWVDDTTHAWWYWDHTGVWSTACNRQGYSLPNIQTLTTALNHGLKVGLNNPGISSYAWTSEVPSDTTTAYRLLEVTNATPEAWPKSYLNFVPQSFDVICVKE